MVAQDTVRTYGGNQVYSNLSKAFGYNDRVVKSDFFIGKEVCIRAQQVLSHHLI